MINEILKNIQIENLNEMQNAALKATSKQVMIFSPTGSGKTVAFLLPLIQRLRKDINGVQVVKLTGTADNNMIRSVLPLFRGHFADSRFALVAATEQDGKPQIALFLSQPLVVEGKNAGALIKAAAKHIQGGGGGQPWMATAGGRNASGLQAAMDELLAAL